MSIFTGSALVYTQRCSSSGCVSDIAVSSQNTSVATVSPDSHSSVGDANVTTTVTAQGAGTVDIHNTWQCPGDPAPTTNVVSVTVQTMPGLSSGSSGANNPNAAKVNDPISTFSGELTNQFAADLSLGGPMPLSFSRYYGSGLSSDGITTGTLGTNWRHNFGWLLNNTGTEVDILSANGALIEFTENGGLWEQSANAAVIYQLVEDGGTGEFTLLDVKNKRLYIFSSAGLLTSISDGLGNQHSLAHNGSDQITSVTDGVGRTLTFTNTGTKLTSVTDGTRTVSFAYTVDDLTSATSALGDVTTYAYATGGLLTSYTQPEGNTPITQVFSNNQVTSQTDGEGNTTTLSFGGSNVTTITDPLAAVTTHTHTASGEISKVQDPDGNSITIASNAAGQRSSVTDRQGSITSMTYHVPSGRFDTLTDADGNTTSFSYTSRVSSGVTQYDLTGITHKNGNTESMVYDASGNLTSSTDQLGNSSTFTYNGNGQKLTSTNRLGGTTSKIYNPDATLASITDPAGNSVSFGYDLLKRPNLTTHPDSSTESFTFDNANRLLTSTDENGNATTLAYDNNGNLSSIINSSGDTISFIYNDNDKMISKTDPMGNPVLTTYDQAGRVATYTDEATNVTTNGYDALGRLTSVTDPLGNEWGTSYNLEGVVASRTNPLGNTTTFNSDDMGRITTFTSELGNSAGFTYDAMGLIATSTDLNGLVTTYSRDNAGHLSSVSLNGTSISTTYTRNNFGQILTSTDPNGNDWGRGYDNGGRLTSSIDPLGNMSAVIYDNRNRISEITYPEAMGTLTMSYDPAGNMLERSYSDGTSLNYTYDGNNRLLTANGITNVYDANGRITNNNGIATGYDVRGRIISITYATGKEITYTYNAGDQLVSVTDWAGANTTFSYDITGQLTGITRPNSINRTNSYDDDSRLVGITEGATASINLTLDANGQVLTATRTLPDAASSNDQLDINNTFDAGSQVTGYTYDELGRITNATGNSYSWNLASRLTSYTKAGSTTTMAYDGLGHRISRTIGTNTTSNYVWSYALLLPSILIEKQGVTDYRYYIRMPGGELLYSMNATTNERSFYHFDEMGNTAFISDDSGSIIGSYAYTPFGGLTSSTGELDNLFTWQGEMGAMDEGNGLYYIRARYFDSDTARFISRDPIEAINPRNINPYQYSFNNPLKYRDITGRKPGQPDAEPSIPTSELGGAAVATLSLGLKSTSSALSGSGIGLFGDSFNLGLHLSEDEIDTDKVLEDVGLITVDVGSIGLTATAATAEAGAVTGASVTGPAIAIYAIARLGIATYEAYWDLQAAEQRLEATKFAGELNKKKAARIQAEKQAKAKRKIQEISEARAQKEQALRDQMKAEEAALEYDTFERKEALEWLAKLLSK